MERQRTLKNSVAVTIVILGGISLKATPAWSNDTLLIQSQNQQPPLNVNVSPSENKLESLSNQQWHWQIEPENTPRNEAINQEYPLEINSNQTKPSIAPRDEELNWQNEQKGEPRETGGTVPFLEF